MSERAFDNELYKPIEYIFRDIMEDPSIQMFKDKFKNGVHTICV